MAAETAKVFDYTIGVGNVLQIRVVTPTGLRQNEIFRVDGKGFIEHPLAGKVRIMNLTPDQAEALLERLIQDRGVLEPSVRVFIIEHSTYRISGEVRKPGIYDLLGPATLRDAVRTAGGLRSQSEDRLVQVKRKGTTTKTLRLSSQGDFPVRPGDEIVVLRESFR